MPARLSVIICTRNRAGYLRLCLEGLKKQTAPASSFEVIVVNNGSTDETSALVAEYSREMGNLTVLREPEPGISRARNTGWIRARSSWVAYLDDDAVPEPDWTEQALKFTTEACPEAGVIGGRATPIWEAERPEWLNGRVASQLAIIDWPQSGWIEKDQWVAGANIIYRRDLLERLGGFDPSLGRTDKNLMSCEEALLNEQILDAGYRVYFAREMSVRHHVQPERMKFGWLIRRAYWNGRSHIAMQVMLGRLKEERASSSFKRYAQRLVKIWKDPKVATLVEKTIKVAFEAGRFHETLRRRCE
jgi:glycosyltransferase involved in cell wall biosynthesis